MMEWIHPNYRKLTENIDTWSEEYQRNHPFPNIYIDDFFDPDLLRKVLSEFPNIDQLKDKIHYENPNESKLATKGENQFGPYTKTLVHYLNSEPFLRFLQELTGIKETLIPDPYFEGGGFHEIKPGGFLKVHVDFHKHRSMQLSRRLNVLVYLNEEWEESYGGHFELWEKDMSACARKILPVFNRMAIFSTTGSSWHGHPDPLTCPPNRSRKSLALYYYTNGRPDEELNHTEANRITTTFAARKGQDAGSMVRYNRMVNTLNQVLPDSVIHWIKKQRNK